MATLVKDKHKSSEVNFLLVRRLHASRYSLFVLINHRQADVGRSFLMVEIHSSVSRSRYQYPSSVTSSAIAGLIGLVLSLCLAIPLGSYMARFLKISPLLIVVNRCLDLSCFLTTNQRLGLYHSAWLVLRLVFQIPSLFLGVWVIMFIMLAISCSFGLCQHQASCDLDSSLHDWLW